MQKLKTRGISISLSMLPVLQWCYIPVSASHWANVKVSIGLHSLPENSGEKTFLYLFINRLLAKCSFLQSWAEADSISGWLSAECVQLLEVAHEPFPPSSRPAIFLAFKFYFGTCNG